MHNHDKYMQNIGVVNTEISNKRYINMKQIFQPYPCPHSSITLRLMMMKNTSWIPSSRSIGPSYPSSLFGYLSGAHNPENLTAQFFPKFSRFMENQQKPSCVQTEKWQKNLRRSRVSTKQTPDLDLAFLKTLITTFCLTMLMDLNFFLIFWVQILSYLPLLQEKTTAEFPSLGSSHNCP